MNSPKVYTVSTKNKILFTILTIPMIALFTWFTMMPFLHGNNNNFWIILFCLVVGGGFVFFFIYALMWIYKSRIEIQQDYIQQHGVRKSTKVSMNQIVGYRVIAGQTFPTFVLQLINHSKKRLKLELMYENQNEIIKWIVDNLTDLTFKEYENDLEKVLNDPILGSTVEQRQWTLKRVKMWANTLNFGVLAIMIIPPIFSLPQAYVIWALIVYPVSVILCVLLSNGLLKITDSQTAFPDITLGIIGPPLILNLFAIHVHILMWGNFWVPFITIWGISAWIISLITKNAKHAFTKIATILIFSLSYGYSSTVTLNKLLDSSAPIKYSAAVVKKDISSGKHTSYNLTLSPWGPRTEPKRVDVGKRTYNKYVIGDTVSISVNEGRFNIPWFSVY